MEIDLFADPPTAKEIESERSGLENSRLLIVQNSQYVAELFHKLLVQAVIILIIFVITGLLYFILPADIFGAEKGRILLFVTVSIMLILSLLWISWRTVSEARLIVPNRGYSQSQFKMVKISVEELSDIDVKRRLNVVNWSRSNGVLTEYVKKVTRQHRHLISLEYIAVRQFMDKIAAKKSMS